MGDTKKDLTGVLELAKKLESSGHAPKPTDGGGEILEVAEVSKIDSWESLEDFGKNHPESLEHELELEPPESEPSIASEGFIGADLVFEETPRAESEPEFDISGHEHLFESSEAPLDSDISRELNLSKVASPPDESSPYKCTEVDPEDVLDQPPLPSKSLTPSRPSSTLTQSHFPTPQAPHAMIGVKAYVEQMPVGKPTVQASFPFSLSIQGRLTPQEQEKLLDVMSRENMGIREVDLELQLAAHRILIPRISEYAGVLLVQALRGAQVQMRLGPSDLIFATEDTRDELGTAGEITQDQSEIFSSEAAHPAEAMALTSLAQIPDLPHFVVIDVVSASASLKSRAVEAENSSEYIEIIEALQRELKYKAFRRGASAVVSFSIQMNQLSLPTHYRITAIGTAIRAPHGHST